ncbi:hypothetical protein ACSQ8M_27675 [Marinovum sp. B10]
MTVSTHADRVPVPAVDIDRAEISVFVYPARQEIFTARLDAEGQKSEKSKRDYIPDLHFSSFH